MAVALGLSATACAGGIGGGRIYREPSGSMEPTIHVGERVVVAPLSGTPNIGDIVVFHPPEGADAERCGRPPRAGEMCSLPTPKKSSVNFLKRIVAGPGDQIYLKQGHVYRKAPGSSQFAPEEDTYINGCGSNEECNFPRPITIPAGYWFMLGDNRGESDDSRFWGPVSTAWLVGVVQT